MKICCTCNQEKPLSDFPLRPGAKDGHRGQCFACRRERNAKSYIKNRTKLLAKQKTYYESHKPQHAARSAAYYKAHKSKLDAYQVQYRATHKEQLRDYFAAYHQKHAARICAYHKARRGQIRDQIRANNNLRKARQRNAPICDFTAKQWAEMKAAYKFRCAYCGKKPQILTMDHVVPLALGGAHTASNIVPACMLCNNHKKAGPAPPFVIIPDQPESEHQD